MGTLAGAGRWGPAPFSRPAGVRSGGDTEGAMEDPLQAGATLGAYRIEEVVAHGGMGTVYRATQERLGRTVALKVIASNLARDPAFRRRFEREARLAASIHHPNLVAVFEAGEERDVLYIAMQYIEGSDLARVVESESWLEPARAVRLIEQVAAALDQRHAQAGDRPELGPDDHRSDDEHRGVHEHADRGDQRRERHEQGEGDRGSRVVLGHLFEVLPDQCVGAMADRRELGCIGGT